MEDILLGTTDRSITVFIPDPASTDGSGKTGLVAADLTVSYTRVETDNDVIVTDVTSSLNNLSALTDAHNDWGLKEVSSTLAPGLYRLDVADAVFASGAWYGIVYVMITSSAAAATPKAFRLVAFNALDGVRFGLTALPNAAAEASGGLPTLSAAQGSNGTINANVHRWLTGTPNALQSGRVDSYLGAVASGVIAAASFAANALDAVWSTATRALTDKANFTLASAYDPAKTAAQAGDSMALTSSERTTLAGVIWNSLTSGLSTVGSIGKLLVDNINATISSRSSHIAADIWAVVTRTLTSYGDGSGFTSIPWNSAWDAEVESEAADALNAYDGPTKAELDTAVNPLALEATAQSILTDTAEIGTAGAGLTVLATAANLATLASAVGSLNNISAAQVLTQVNAALDTAISELAQGQPTATPSLRTATMLLYMALRNQLETDASEKRVFNDAGTCIAKKTLADDGTTYTETQMVTGP